MGAGPLHLARALGVDAEEIQPRRAWRAEIATSFELYGELAARVHELREPPLVLSGHCGATIGVAAGLGTEDLALVWFDAHGDYNSPDTTESGFLDGMCLSVLTGRSWKRLATSIPHFAPLDPRRVIHCGARDWTPGEREMLLADGVRVARNASDASFDGLEGRRILIHVDLDVIDPSFGRANHYAAEGGLSPDDVLAVIAAAARHAPLAGLVLASYDPSCDPEERIAAIAAHIVRSAGVSPASAERPARR
jgi:arginase